jgi:hypothetical protein
LIGLYTENKNKTKDTGIELENFTPYLSSAFLVERQTEGNEDFKPSHRAVAMLYGDGRPRYLYNLSDWCLVQEGDTPATCVLAIMGGRTAYIIKRAVEELNTAQ